MTSVALQQQNAIFLDPENVSGTASDSNRGISASQALRTNAELHRRIGDLWLIQPGRDVVITYLSNCEDDDALNLTVQTQGASSLMLRGTLPTAVQGQTAGPIVQAQAATNTLSELPSGLSLVGADEDGGFLYFPSVAGGALTPIVRETTFLPPDTNRIARYVDPQGVLSPVTVGLDVGKFFPLRVPIGSLRAVRTVGSVSVFGLTLPSIEEAVGLNFNGCAIGTTTNVRSNNFRNCTVGYGVFSAGLDGFNQLISSSLRLVTLLSQDILTDAPIVRNATIRACQSVRAVGVMVDASSLLTVDGCGRLEVNGVNGIFGGGGGLMRLRAGAVIHRDDANGITMAGTLVQWPDSAPLAEVFTPDSLVPPSGAGVNPGASDWPTLNGNGGFWLHQRTGARVTVP